MARISSYPRELDIADNDAWIGTESSNRSTKNFTAATVAKYLNINGKISISAQMGFKFILNNSPANGEFSGPADNSNIGDITTLQVSSIDTGGQNTVQFMGYLIGSDILISKQNDINTFGHFTISSYVANGAGVYTLSLALITGGSNGILNKNVFYDFAVFTLSTKNIDDLTYDLDVPTGTTSINLAGSDGTNDAVELFGGTNIGITRDNANRITFTGSAITAGTGIAIVTTSIDETISINYSGTNNAILSATAYSGTVIPVTNQIWFDDVGAGNIVSYAPIDQLPFDNYNYWVLSNGTSTTNISSQATTEFLAGAYITIALNGAGSGGNLTISHNATSKTDTTSTASPSPGGTVDLVSSLTTNTEGHVTDIETKTVTWPSDTDTNYILNKAAGSTDLILSADGTTQNTIQFAGTTNEVTVTGVTEDAYQIGLPDEVTIDTSLTVMGTVQSSFQGQVTIPATPSVATDAASKSYVLSQVGGLGTFQGGYDATSDPGSPVLTGASNIAVGTGDFYTVTASGAITFSDSPTGDATLEVGDFIFANSDIVAGSNPASTDYTLVLADQNIAGAGTTDGNTAKGIAGFNSTQFSVSPTGWVQTNNNGTVTGTGVANKVAYWTSATNIDDGPITFSTNDSTFAGSVVVNGTSTFIPISTVNYIVTNSGNALRLISGIPSGVTWIGKPVEYYASEYSFSTDVTSVGGYSQQFVIETNGNVGIGETSPTTKLDIGGMADPVVRIKSGAGGDPQLRFDASQANRSALIQFYDNGSSAGGFISYLHNGDKMNFGSGSSTGITMTVGDGKVGIGTDSPSRKLVVAQSDVTEPSGIDANTSILIKNNTWSGIQMISTEATGSFITFGDDAAGFAGRIQYSHATNAMQFETAAAERMRITSGGEVGISISNPLFELCIGAVDAPNRNGLEFAISNTDAGTNIVQNYNRATAAYTPMNLAAKFLTIGTGTSATQRIILDENGRFGLSGTNTITAPSSLLQVNQQSVGSALNYLVGTSITFGANGFSAIQLNPAANSAVEAGLRLQNNNNDIGAFSPLIVFSALSTSNSYNHTYASIYGVKTASGADTNWTRGAIVFATSQGTGVNEKMRLNQDGKLGLGTDNPNGKLTILEDNGVSKGDFDFQQIVYNGGWSTNTFGLAAIQWSDGVGSSNTIGRIGVTYTGSKGQFQIKDLYHNGYAGSGVVFTARGDGHVGIGTQTPSTLLELNQDASGAQGATLRLTNAIGGSGAGVAVEFVGPGTQPIHAKIITVDAGAYDSNLIFQTKATGTGGALANRLTINNVGNVGIGTTTPASNTKLDVVGAIKTQTVAHSWYRCGPITSALAYRHIKTNLDMGVGGTNIQYIMGGFEIKGYGYYGSYPGFGHGTCMFHNWSGGFASLNVRNYAMAGFVQNPYVSSDGFCVIVLRQNTYMQPVIDFCQYYTPYPWRTSVVTAESVSANLTGVY